MVANLADIVWAYIYEYIQDSKFIHEVFMAIYRRFHAIFQRQPDY